ncbi:sensor histidine kinase [Nonomuraea soli]|uniref:histidine kinase n=1 Tax=Nonomuraea soli TaxID=1032476 RepID=A0A7W0CI52_9ACTN|nr:histidine kinase [Nonomuraea soli]MBA2891621.1 signal transduction histidine kinase [Nonomuraea soli]
MKREALIAVGVFAVGLVLILGGAVVHRDGVPWWVTVVPLALTCCGVVIRRRWPVGALVVGSIGFAIDVAFVAPTLPTVLVYTDNLYAAALYGPPKLGRWMLGVTTVVAVAAGATAGFITGDWKPLALVGIQSALVLVTPVTTALVLRQHRDQALAERARADQVAHLAELDRQAAVTAERTRMARELHDTIANHFSAIAIQSTAALSRPDLDAGTVRKIMESVRENSLSGMAEMRTMIGLLRQDGEEVDEATRPRLADAGALVERSRRAGLDSDFSVEGTPVEVPASVDLAGYRIIQEALSNALKHGDRRGRARVVVAYAPGHVTLTVENSVNGAGRSGLPGSGAGLIGMRERAALVGGEFEAGPYVDGGRGEGARGVGSRAEGPRGEGARGEGARGEGARGTEFREQGSREQGSRGAGWRVRARLPLGVGIGGIGAGEGGGVGSAGSGGGLAGEDG